MILMVVISSILVAIVTLIEYNYQSEYYHNDRLERKENQLILSLNYVIQNSTESLEGDDQFDSKIDEIMKIMKR